MRCWQAAQACQHLLLRPPQRFFHPPLANFTESLHMTGNASRFRVRWTARLSLIAFAALTLAYLPGCPGGGTSNIVKGKVTMDDKPVAGIVALVADGKKF